MDNTEKLECITNGLKPKTPPLNKRYTKKEIQECIESSHGLVTLICNKLDCTYSQFYNYVKKNEGMFEALQESKKSFIDIAEQRMMECLESKDERIKLQAAMHVLKTKGSEFGWQEQPKTQIQQQINVSNDLDIRKIFGIDDTHEQNT